MTEQNYLAFTVETQRYSIDSAYLEEMLQLPEVTLLPTASQDIIGVINFRGEIVPIIDLKLSLGYPPTPFKITDSLLILKQDQLRVGLIVNGIGAIERLAITDLETTNSLLDVIRAQAIRKTMLLGELPSANADGEQVVTESALWLLDEPQHWLRYVEIQQLVSVASLLLEKQSLEGQTLEEQGDAEQESATGAEPIGMGTAIFCPDATPEERAIFQQRAYSLRQPIAEDLAETELTLAIVMIGGSRWGVDLTTVREFVEMPTVTPVPCCPPHVIGNTNLRGDILTLIDIRQCLNLPHDNPPHDQTSDTANDHNESSPGLLTKAKVMVVEIENDRVGIVVQSVLEAVFTLRLSAQVSSTQVTAAQPDPRYLQSGFAYDEETIGLLNLTAMLTQGVLRVEEMV